MKVLIVEDEAEVRRLVASQLELQGATVTESGTKAGGLRALEDEAFDVVILDLTLPDGSGLELLRVLRELEPPPHVMVLSGAGSESDRVRALELGADDYVVKPFFVRELTARILAVRRRTDALSERTLRFDPIAIDLSARRVTLAGTPVDLTAKEFDLLAFLAARPGHVFSRDELLRAVWRSSEDWQQTATVTEHVHRLRAKLESNPADPRTLTTVRGAGYRFDPPPSSDLPTKPGTPVGDEEGTFVLVEGRIVSADPVTVAMLGATDDRELLGRDASLFIAPQSLGAVERRRAAIYAGRSPLTQIVALRRVDGASDVFVELGSSPTVWNGQPGRLNTIRPSTDPSARLRQTVTGVFSEVADAVIVTDPHLHVRSWNHAAERLYGWAEEEVLGHHLADVIPTVEEAGGAGSAQHTLESQGRWYGEVEQIARDGTRVAVVASMTLIRDEGGEVIAVVSVNRPALPPLDGGMPSSAELIESDIRRGILGGEFDVHYQPVVTFHGLRFAAVEALVRWHHPERGLLGPAAFLDVAERTGIILDLGRLVLQKAGRQVARWREEGHDLELAVNLSAAQLASPGLFDDITEMLTGSGLDPEALWLEVTETALVEDLEQAAELLHRLAALGVRVAIDDFGTGWASLTYLREFPVHSLKIDRTFVAGIGHNPQDAAIARSILSLGSELGLHVVAEGVETVEQQTALEALGCKYGQGFLYGAPSSAAGISLGRSRRLTDPPPAR
jgi:PAS domain S-box-containing protein